MYAAMSFSMLNFSRACVAHSIASLCISSDISAFLMTALRSAISPRNKKTKKNEKEEEEEEEEDKKRNRLAIMIKV